MKRIGCLMTMFLSLMLPFGEPISATNFSFNRAFDEYGSICWEDEKARLDNFAIALLNDDRTTLGHIIVYDGRRACRGEAVARAIRAKKYLVEYRRVEADRIVWRWGGDPKDLSTTLLVTTRRASISPFRPTLPIYDGKIVCHCERNRRT